MYQKYITFVFLAVQSCLANTIGDRKPNLTGANEIFNPPLINRNLLEWENFGGNSIYPPLKNEQEFVANRIPTEWSGTANKEVKRYRNSEHINDFYRSVRYPHNERIREHLCMVSQILDDTDPEFITIKEECHEGNFNIIWKGEERQIACKQHYTTVIFNMKEAPEKVQLHTGCIARIY